MQPKRESPPKQDELDKNQDVEVTLPGGIKTKFAVGGYRAVLLGIMLWIVEAENRHYGETRQWRDEMKATFEKHLDQSEKAHEEFRTQLRELEKWKAKVDAKLGFSAVETGKEISTAYAKSP